MVHARIESMHNERFKQALRLSESNSALKKAGLALAEGLHLVPLAMANPSVQVDSVWLPESLIQNPEWLGVLELQKGVHGCPMFELPDRLYKKLSRLDTPTGPLVFFSPPAIQASLNLNCDVVVLDGIQDPGNVGTLLRNCVASGLVQIVCNVHSAWVWADKTLRAGMGAQFALNFFAEQTLLDALSTAGRSVPVRATTLGLTSQSLFDCDLRAPGIWVFGSEGQGVSTAWLERATQCIKIPQTGPIESLNVAVSSGICLYEQWRQRR